MTAICNLFIGDQVPPSARPYVALMVSLWSSSQDRKVSGALLGKTPEDVLAQIDAGRAIALLSECGKVVIGYATFYPLDDGVWEMGTVVINPEYRGQHLARRLYEGADRLHRILGGVVWTTTHSDAVVHLAVTHGFKSSPFSNVPDSNYQGLCRDARCFVNDAKRPGRCADESDAGGACKLCVRRLSAAAA